MLASVGADWSAATTMRSKQLNWCAALHALCSIFRCSLRSLGRSQGHQVIDGRRRAPGGRQHDMVIILLVIIAHVETVLTNQVALGKAGTRACGSDLVNTAWSWFRRDLPPAPVLPAPVLPAPCPSRRCLSHGIDRFVRAAPQLESMLLLRLRSLLRCRL